MEYNEPIPDKDYKVLVKCFTFNQSKYIKDALNGFTMQKTDFPFICTIIDDCSTDGELEVIKAYLDNEFLMSASEHFETEYANITIAQHKANTNCTFAIYFLKYNHYSKKDPKAKYLKKWRECCEYEAICEGDDYWTDPLKLQKQVDYLDNHPDCGMVYTKVEKYIQSKNAVDGTWGKKCCHLDLLLGASPVPTLTVCYRENIAKIYYDSIKTDPKWRLGDVPLWLYFIKYSSVHFIDEITGVYRELNESASHSMDFNKRSSFINSAFDCRAFYAEKYWSKILAKKVVETKLLNLINTSFEFDEKLNINFISEIRKYKIFNVKLHILYLFSCCSVMRHYYHNRIFKNKR